MKKDIIDHLAICTDDIAKSVIWYIDNFNCNILYQDKSWAMLEFDNVKLALVLPDQHPFHFAILKDDVESYGEPVTHRDGSVSVYVKDRSGNNIEILRY
jgi:catechol 2,3-dioxygenase-like lactoylglutathione lyase family enzyme|tara:strand:+ start:829 stop:1125 length:297 start_codon:yes stop_codon:yes gene_type:complete